MMKVRCPICDRLMEGGTADWPQFPFCSARCRLVDLGRWLGEKYHVRPETAPEESGSSEEETDTP